MKSVVCFSTLLAIALAAALPAQAISFDSLEAEQTVSATTANPVAFSTVTSLTSLGGKRLVQATRSSGLLVSSVIGGGILSHSQNASTTGSTLVTWDGVGNQTVTPSGLGGLDLTEDGATSIRVGITTFDFPNGQPIQLVFILYDASDPSGSIKRSTGVIQLDAPINTSFSSPVFKEVLFTDFIVPQGLQGVNLKNVGAISFLINGLQSPAHDLEMVFIGTNGRCDHIPANNLVLDQCGVCNGPNACLDCEGTPFGTKVAGTSCTTGSFGVCSDGTYSANCNCTQTNQPGTEVCDSLDNNCNAAVDEGFSIGETCTVGIGACSKTGAKICAPAGTSTCSATAGNPSEEICDAIDNDCDGAADEGSPKTGPLVDACGVCGGDGKGCLDCNGVLNGAAKIDSCGVCGGDGKGCLDCKGVVNGTAKIDSCGVCGGDGTSCLTCETVNVFTTLAALDGGAKEQEAVVKRATQLLTSQPDGKKYKAFIKNALDTAHQLQLANWILSWTIPSVITTCKDVAPICVTTSNVPKLVEYRSRNDELKALAITVLSKIKAKKGTKAFVRAKDVRKWADFTHLKNLNESFTVPETNYSCSQ